MSWTASDFDYLSAPKKKPAKRATRPTKVKRKVPSEALESQRLVDYLRARGIRFTHIPNETSSRAQGIKNKRMGVSPGVPDYMLILPETDKLKPRLMFLEMKRREGGRTSQEQFAWLAALQDADVYAFVVKGFDEAKKTIEMYL